MIQKTAIGDFAALCGRVPVLDVRSPAEYAHAHIPGAHSLPLFSDDERKVVGTLYKQESREQAIKAGLDYFGVKMRRMVEQVEELLQVSGSKAQGEEKTLVVHCWRGGMRSAGVAWLLDLYGFDVRVLVGGYKAYRRWALKQFEQAYDFKVLGGYTGSGKTELLHRLAVSGHAVVDLEGIAHHKGSAFGALGEQPQPRQEQFENDLALELYRVQERAGSGAIWLEDESRRIGNVNLPERLWNTMRKAPLYFLDIPFEERLDYLVKVYGRYGKEELANPVMRISKRLGGLNTKNALNYLVENNYKECFRILLHYYDKFYKQDIVNREAANESITTIPCEHVSAEENYELLKYKVWKYKVDMYEGEGEV